MAAYTTRIVDAELDELLKQLPAIAIEGPKGVGKTATAERRAATTFRLDEPAQQDLARANPARLLASTRPVLFDEWQHVPMIWDAVRRAVDADWDPNHYLLVGSAVAANAPVHSGAGRIASVRMRPMSLAERGLGAPTVSLRSLLTGTDADVTGTTGIVVADYAHEIVRSGFPRLRMLCGRALRTQLQDYVARIIDRDFKEQGHVVRRPEMLRRWLRAYAAATASTTTLETIRDAASQLGEAPTRPTVVAYREILQRLWILDEVPGWSDSNNQFVRMTQAPKHHLADPALAASLLGLDERALLDGTGTTPSVKLGGSVFGHLFESLVTLSVRTYAQAAEAEVSHLREKDGRHEVDLIVESQDGNMLAIEVKLSPDVSDDDVEHLHWFKGRAQAAKTLDLVVINTGANAYRRQDGVAVVPAALLGA